MVVDNISQTRNERGDIAGHLSTEAKSGFFSCALSVIFAGLIFAKAAGFSAPRFPPFGSTFVHRTLSVLVLTKHSAGLAITVDGTIAETGVAVSDHPSVLASRAVLAVVTRVLRLAGTEGATLPVVAHTGTVVGVHFRSVPAQLPAGVFAVQTVKIFGTGASSSQRDATILAGTCFI